MVFQISLAFLAKVFDKLASAAIDRVLCCYRVLPMLRACALSFVLMGVAWLALTFAPNIYVVLLSTISRSFGSSAIWVYSTLMLQLRVPNALLGRILAVEMAFHTVSPRCSVHCKRM